MKQTTNKTKKTKRIVAIILSLVILIGGIFVSISLIKTHHIMKFNNPDKIIVYYNSNANNIVFEPKDSEFHTICNMIKDSHKQTIISAVFNGQLFKDVRVVEHDLKKVDFEGLKVSFVYNTPQIVKLKSKIHPSNIWYQTLMFEISSNDTFDYNPVTIIPPENNGLSQFVYSAHYMSYSNLATLHNYLSSLIN